MAAYFKQNETVMKEGWTNVGIYCQYSQSMHGNELSNLYYKEPEKIKSTIPKGPYHWSHGWTKGKLDPT